MIEFINYLERMIEGCESLGSLDREKATYQAVLKEYRKQCNMPIVVRCASCKNDSNFSESGKQEICIEGEYRYVTATICNSCGAAIEIEFFD